MNDVVKALEGSVPFFSFNVADELYVATGFVIQLVRLLKLPLLRFRSCPVSLWMRAESVDLFLWQNESCNNILDVWSSVVEFSYWRM